MHVKAALTNIAICAVVGGVASAFTPAKWLAASLWVFAALFINGALALWKDAHPGGFDNPDGSNIPPFAKGLGVARFWLQSLVVAGSATALGFYIQFE